MGPANGDTGELCGGVRRDPVRRWTSDTVHRGGWDPGFGPRRTITQYCQRLLHELDGSRLWRCTQYLGAEATEMPSSHCCSPHRCVP